MSKIFQIEPLLTAADRAEVMAVVDSGFITEGRKTREFEEAAAAFLEVPFTVATNNATAALSLALMALGVRHGDEVIVPDFTFIATANAVCMTGATPVFADISRETFTLDLADAERRITPRTRAIVPVHLNGRCCDMPALLALAAKHHLHVVEDAAQAMGSRAHGKALGTFGAAGVYSLGTTKIITTGQGALIACREPAIREQLLRLKDQGRLNRSAEIHDTIGFNFKFTDLQAALGVSQLRQMPERMERKRNLYRAYQRALAGSGVHFPPIDLTETVPWFVDILTDERETIMARLERSEIQSRPFYLPIHSQPCYHAPGSFPNTEFISPRGLWLPSSVSLTESDVERVARALVHEPRAVAAR